MPEQPNASARRPDGLRCEIFPADIDAAADFYTRVLGFRIVRDERQSAWPYLALARGEVRLGAAQRTPGDAEAAASARRPPIGVELVLEVADLIAERDRIDAEGWPIDDDVTLRPWGLSDFRVLDPDGYYWRLTTR